MAAHSSILAEKTPRTEKTGGSQVYGYSSWGHKWLDMIEQPTTTSSLKLGFSGAAQISVG